jgi:ribosome maturation factor RimP
VLGLYIDKEGGVTIDDCVKVSREVGSLIDVKDVIKHEYVLEVSSPGLDRPIKKERDLIQSIGKMVKVKMDIPLKNRRNFTGYLKDFRDGLLYLEVDGEVFELSWANVGRANLVYEF